MEEAERLQRELETRIGDAGAAIATEILVGSPGAALGDRTTEGVDLVVMATHGRGPISRAWIGSVTDALIRTAVPEFNEACAPKRARPSTTYERDAMYHYDVRAAHAVGAAVEGELGHDTNVIEGQLLARE